MYELENGMDAVDVVEEMKEAEEMRKDATVEDLEEVEESSEALRGKDVTAEAARAEAQEASQAAVRDSYATAKGRALEIFLRAPPPRDFRRLRCCRRRRNRDRRCRRHLRRCASVAQKRRWLPIFRRTIHHRVLFPRSCGCLCVGAQRSSRCHRRLPALSLPFPPRVRTPPPTFEPHQSSVGLDSSVMTATPTAPPTAPPSRPQPEPETKATRRILPLGCPEWCQCSRAHPMHLLA